MLIGSLSVGPGFIYVPSYGIEGEEFSLDFPFHEWRDQAVQICRGQISGRPFYLRPELLYY